jgi:phage replication-related protein YjqB (UPF0714/DUF867 family)
MDGYATYADLDAHETEGVDYAVRVIRRPSAVAVVAIHGGGIEPCTAELAGAIAGSDHTFCAFEGIRAAGNARLHLDSCRFDEPRCVGAVRASVTAVSVHGCRGERPVVHVGGRHRTLGDALRSALRAGGFEAVRASAPGMEGVSPRNICNRCRSGMGVQLELSAGLRKGFFAPTGPGGGFAPSDRGRRFADTVRAMLGRSAWA